MSGYFKVSNGCTQCPENCESCLGNSECDQCIVGYFVNETFGFCEPCTDPGCQVCSTEFSCEICKTGLIRNINGICSKCPSRCVACDKANTCIECEKGFYPDERTGMCFKCPGYCLDCNSYTHCKKCDENYIRNMDGTCTSCMRDCLLCESPDTCSKCDEGSFINSDKQCQRCSKGCIKCSKYNKCFECDSRLFVSEGFCSPCTDKSCEKCPGNVCKQCGNGFYMSSAGICTKCFKN